MRQVLNNCTHLTELILSKCRKITGTISLYPPKSKDTALSDIGSSGTTNSLQILDLTSGIFSSNFRLKLQVDLSEKSLIQIIKSTPSMHTLYLSFTKNVTDKVVSQLAESCKYLHRVYLSRYA